MTRWSMHHGEALQWLQSLPSDYADAIVCDPPYSSGGATRGDRMAPTGSKYVVERETTPERPDFHGDNRDQRGYLAWCGVWMFEAMRVVGPGCPILVFTDWRQLPVTTDALQVAGWVWRGITVWDKGEGVRPQLGRFRAQAEYVVVGSKGPMTGTEQVVAPGVLKHGRQVEDRQHITGKPVPLMEGLLAIVRKGGLVLDPFSGSGSTGVACLRTGRRFAGCELGDSQHALAVSRLTAEEQDRPWLAPPEQTGLFGGGAA